MRWICKLFQQLIIRKFSTKRLCFHIHKLKQGDGDVRLFLHRDNARVVEKLPEGLTIYSHYSALFKDTREELFFISKVVREEIYLRQIIYIHHCCVQVQFGVEVFNLQATFGLLLMVISVSITVAPMAYVTNWLLTLAMYTWNINHTTFYANFLFNILRASSHLEIILMQHC